MSAIDFNSEANPASTASNNDNDMLESWHRQYNALNADDLSPDDPVILAAQSEPLDRYQIELEMQQSLTTVNVDQGFCEHCRRVLGNWPNLGSPKRCDIVRTFEMLEIEVAARAGCRFCAFIMSRLKLEGLFEIFRRIEARLRTLGDNRTASLAILSNGPVQAQWVNYPGKEATHFRYGARLLPCAFLSNTLSTTSLKWNPDKTLKPFEVAKAWLTRCADTHENCLRKQTYRPPTRLVSVGQSAVRLVITADLDKPPRYATLSYCWGRKPFTKLKQDTLMSFLNQIPLETLPQTFIDAIDVTRQLGLEYIWIDALCIIQDEPDQSDWKQEAGRMMSVYGGSSVNIAISTAPSVYDGFLKPSVYSGGFVARVSTSDRSDVRGFYSPYTYEEVTEDSHLAGRAWCFQERLLPARTIHLSDTGLVWECCSHLASEALPDGFQSIYDSSLLCRDDKAWRTWSQLVRVYSGANLTFTSDRLPALSGIAQRQHKLTGDTYLAGLWKSQLIEQLLWEPSGRRSLRPRPWRAPSWSWASVDGQSSYSGNAVPRFLKSPFLIPRSGIDFPVGPRDPYHREYVRIHDVWTIIPPGFDDPHSVVESGELTLDSSYFIRGQIYKTGDADVPGYLVRTVNGIEAAPVHLDCLRDISELGGDFVYLLPVKRNRLTDGPFIKNKNGPSRIRQAIRGLVIQSVGSSKGKFRRIGYFSFENHFDRDGAVYRAFLENLDNGNSIARDCIEGDKWQHRITIV